MSFIDFLLKNYLHAYFDFLKINYTFLHLQNAFFSANQFCRRIYFMITFLARFLALQQNPLSPEINKIYHESNGEKKLLQFLLDNLASKLHFLFFKLIFYFLNFVQ